MPDQHEPRQAREQTRQGGVGGPVRHDRRTRGEHECEEREWEVAVGEEREDGKRRCADQDQLAHDRMAPAGLLRHPPCRDGTGDRRTCESGRGGQDRDPEPEGCRESGDDSGALGR
jgi:hypothetical protein